MAFHNARWVPLCLRGDQLLVALLLLVVLVGRPSAQVAQPNFVRQSDSGRYFQLEDGTDFLPIGHNESWMAPGMRTLVPSSENFSLQAAREYFNKLRNHGVNVIRIWVDAPTNNVQWDGVSLEKPIGVWDPDNVRMLDLTFQLAEEYGIYLILMPYDTFWLYYGSLPYLPKYIYLASEVGGPLHNPGDFLNSPASVEYHKARWRFLIDRYGGSNRIFAYDVMNEVDGDGAFHGATDARKREYVTQMSAYILQYERERWGKNHMVTVSTVNAEPWNSDIRYLAFKHPNIDFSCTHMLYNALGSRTDTIAGCVRVNQGLKFFFSQMPAADARPYFTSEWWSTAENTFWNPLDPEFEDEQAHNVAWAHFASGGAGGGMYLKTWTDFSETQFDNYLAMSRIARHIRWARFNSRNIDSRISVTGGNTDTQTIIPMGCSDDYTALLWLLQDVNVATGLVTGASVRLDGMTPGDYSALFFDTRTGDLVHQSKATAIGGAVTLPVPDFQKDIALVLKHLTAESPLNAKPRAALTEPQTWHGTGNNPLTLAAEAEDPEGVAQVHFNALYDDGTGRAWRRIGTTTAPPHRFDWNLAGLTDQTVDLSIDVVDTGGQSIAPAEVITNVQLEHAGGDVTKPFASLEFPGVAATLTELQSVKLKAGAWDHSSGVSKIQFWTGPMVGGGGTLLGEVHQPPWELTVNLTPFDNTTRWFTVDVFDGAGNSSRPSDNHLNVLVDSDAVTTPVVASFLTPSSGAVVDPASPTLHLTAVCSRDSKVDHVTYRARIGSGGYLVIGTATTPPYAFDWTPANPTSQLISLRIDVTDKLGKDYVNLDHVSGIYFSVPTGDVWAPWGHLISPAGFTTFALPATLNAIAGDPVSGVKSVTFKYWHEDQWHEIGTVSEEPYRLRWDGGDLPSGTVLDLALDVEDNAGNVAQTSDRQVNVEIFRPNSVGHWNRIYYR